MSFHYGQKLISLKHFLLSHAMLFHTRKYFQLQPSNLVGYVVAFRELSVIAVLAIFFMGLLKLGRCEMCVATIFLGLRKSAPTGAN